MRLPSSLLPGRILALLTLALLLAACAPAPLSFTPPQLDCGETDEVAVDMTLPDDFTRGVLAFVEDNGNETEIDINVGDMERIESNRLRQVVSGLGGCQPGTYTVEVREPGGEVISSADLIAIDSR